MLIQPVLTGSYRAGAEEFVWDVGGELDAGFVLFYLGGGEGAVEGLLVCGAAVGNEGAQQVQDGLQVGGGLRGVLLGGG